MTTAATKKAARKEDANKQAEIAADEMETPIDDSATADLPDEREQWFQSPGFARMRDDWSGNDRQHMQRMEAAIKNQVFRTFPDAYAIMSDIYDTVRQVEWLDEDAGIPHKDPHGFVIWKKSPTTGAYIEDWTRLTTHQKEDFLYRITTAIFEWEQKAEELRMEALFAKALWTEKFAIEYDAPMSGTIDDRNAVANKDAAQERYFALMKTSVSRRADALVRSMERIALRIRDTLQM